MLSYSRELISEASVSPGVPHVVSADHNLSLRHAGLKLAVFETSATPQTHPHTVSL